MMEHPRLDELWLDLAEGNLDEESDRSLRAHLDACADCGPRYRQLSAAHSLSRSVGQRVAAGYSQVAWWTYPDRISRELGANRPMRGGGETAGMPDWTLRAAGEERGPSPLPAETRSTKRPSRRHFWLLAGAVAASFVIMATGMTFLGHVSGPPLPDRELVQVSNRREGGDEASVPAMLRDPGRQVAAGAPQKAFRLPLQTVIVGCPASPPVVALYDIPQGNVYVLRRFRLMVSLPASVPDSSVGRSAPAQWLTDASLPRSVVAEICASRSPSPDQ